MAITVNIYYRGRSTGGQFSVLLLGLLARCGAPPSKRDIWCDPLSPV